jgi:transposase
VVEETTSTVEETFIRSSALSLSLGRVGKRDVVSIFVDCYREAVLFYVDYLWTHDIEFGNGRIWSLEKNLLDIPSMISTTDIPIKSKLSGRALKCAATQACGIVSAVVKKRKKDLFMKKTMEEKGYKVPKRLLKRIDKKITKPSCKNINCEINSICADIQENHTSKTQEIWLELHSIFTKDSEYGKGFLIKIPLKKHIQYNKWSDNKKLNSFLLNEHQVCVRFEVPKPAVKTEGRVVGVDQGKITCLTLSDGQVSNKDIHGHDLNSVVNKLARRKRGSNGFRRAQEHRKNLINANTNRINLNGIKELRVENIENITYGKNVGRGLKHWTNTQIRDSLIKACEESSVLFTPVPNEFNSQCCSECGWVQKKNRKGKVFLCQKCSFCEDADVNSSVNIEKYDTRAVIPFGFRSHRFNLKGFYWKSNGFFLEDGQELIVPDSIKS